MNDDHQFRVGVNLFLLREGKVLLGQRKNCSGAGEWGLPGGHLEFGEAMQDGVRRELKEETGLDITDLEFVNLTNCPQPGRHYIQVAFAAREVVGEPVIMEPDRCAEWRWFGRDELPENLFFGHRTQIEGFLKAQKMFIDSEKVT